MQLKLTLTFTEDDRRAIALSKRKGTPARTPNPVSRSQLIEWVGELIGQQKAQLEQRLQRYKLNPDPDQQTIPGVLTDA